MITGSHKCSTVLSYFKIKQQSLGVDGWHCMRRGRGAPSKARWALSQGRTGSSLSLTATPPAARLPQLEGLCVYCFWDPPTLPSYSRRTELWEIACLFMLYACYIPGRKAQMIRRCSSQLYSVTCHCGAASAFQMHTAISQALQHSWAVCRSLLAWSSSIC